MNRMNKSSLQHGFGAVEGLLIIIVIGLAGTLGWVAYNKLVTKSSTGTANVQEAKGVADLKKPVEINSADDVENASKDIDAVDLDDDSTLLDAEDSIESLD